METPRIKSIFPIMPDTPELTVKLLAKHLLVQSD